MGDAERTQLAYYARTAAQYEDVHVHEHDEHSLALEHVAAYLELIRAESVLDTGCGTGRGVRFLMRRFPDLRVHGNDRSPELLAASGLPSELVDCVSSEELPYEDGSFDAVVECGVLHHVERPERVVAEMLRVARKAIFLSDSNIYGQGRMPARVAKLMLANVRLLDAVNWVRRGGKRWYYTDGDGVAYSYSVFDSYRQIAAACERVVALPLTGTGRSALLGSPNVLLCGFKTGRGGP